SSSSPSGGSSPSSSTARRRRRRRPSSKLGASEVGPGCPDEAQPFGARVRLETTAHPDTAAAGGTAVQSVNLISDARFSDDKPNVLHAVKTDQLLIDAVYLKPGQSTGWKKMADA